MTLMARLRRDDAWIPGLFLAGFLVVLVANGALALVALTTWSGQHAYFESAVTLLFFLLVGRYLDRRARGKARAAAGRLLALRSESVTVLEAGDRRCLVPTAQVAPGMRVLVAVGERIPVDGRVAVGTSELDSSLITGESLPGAVAVGDRVFAGTLNLGAPLTLEVTAIGAATLLAEIARLMELAEQGRAGHVALADRIARLYAPLVHGLGLATFLGWTLLAGAPWQTALLTAVAVLINTCPCALGLAVPAVQVIAALKARGLAVRLLSGDRAATVRRVAETLGIANWQAGCTPADKVRHLEALAAAGRHALMVGDGLNDAPALAAAAVSLSPSSAIDISQTAADALFQGRRLAPILELLEVARRADRLVKQNFALAFVYHAVTIPLAVLGLVTPLVAAVSMSASSVLVISNALRLGRGRLGRGRLGRGRLGRGRLGRGGPS